MKVFFIYFLLAICSANPTAWYGTAPFCEGNVYKCDPFDMLFLKYDRNGDGKVCWSGQKVQCMLKTPKSEMPQENASDDGKVTLKVMSYNVFERPWVATHDGQVERTCRIPRAIRENYPDIDVIGLQEDFMNGCTEDMNFRKLFRFYGWPFHTRIVGQGATVNGGVRIISKYRLENVKYHVYKSWAAGTADAFADKGFVYAYIKKQGKIFHLISTHLQAQECSICDIARYNQIKEIKAFIDESQFPKDEPVILIGDLNVDRVLEKQKEETIMNLLNFKVADKTGDLKYTYDPSLNDVVEPGESPLWIDYVAYSKDHKLPVSAKFGAVHLKNDKIFSYCNTAPLSPYWIYRNSGLCRKVKETVNFSDHFPVIGELIFN